MQTLQKPYTNNTKKENQTQTIKIIRKPYNNKNKNQTHNMKTIKNNTNSMKTIQRI